MYSKKLHICLKTAKNVKFELKTVIFVFQYCRKAIFVIMKAIIEYTDYRKFMQDYYDERKRSSAFTWREFAQNAGFASAIFLKYVIGMFRNNLTLIQTSNTIPLLILVMEKFTRP